MIPQTRNEDKFMCKVQTLASRGLFSRADEVIGTYLDDNSEHLSSDDKQSLQRIAYGILVHEAFILAEHFAYAGNVDAATGYMGVLRKYERKAGTEIPVEEKLRIWNDALLNGIRFELSKAIEYGSGKASYRSEQALNRAVGYLAECVKGNIQKGQINGARGNLTYARNVATGLGVSIDDQISELEKFLAF